MGQKKQRNRYAGREAMGERQELLNNQAQAQYNFEQDLSNLKGAGEVTDFYAGLGFQGIPIDPATGKPDMALAATTPANLQAMGAQQNADWNDYNSVGYADKELGYNAGITSEAGLARGAGTGLSNVFNNLQVSTAGADLAAQEADQSLAASQEAMMMMGGGGGATALAAQAAKSKAGISAGIDQQVKANEIMRAQGEQALQRDLLAQGNLASQFGLGQAQFNVGAQNQAAQFSQAAQNQAYQFDASAQNQAAQFRAAAQNQASQFNAGQANNMTLQKFGMENQLEQFNANASNEAFTAQANAINSGIAQNASDEMRFDLARAGGQHQTQSDKYDALMGFLEISMGQLNDADRLMSENTGTIQQGRYSDMSKNHYNWDTDDMVGTYQDQSSGPGNVYKRLDEMRDKFTGS